MAIQATAYRRDYLYEEDDDDDEEDEEKNPHAQTHEYDEEIDETEGDLIENYLYLTRRCNALRHSPTTSALDTMQQQQQPTNHASFLRQSSLTTDHDHNHFERSLYTSKHCNSLNDFSNSINHQNLYSSSSRLPTTIYYDDRDYFGDGSFSLVKLFARMKARLKHDRRYKPNSTHELLREEDSQEWFELTKNTHDILNKVLLPDGGYDAIVRRQKASHTREHSRRRSRERDPVLSLDVEDDDDDQSKIHFDIDDELNTEGDEEFDQIIWTNFLKSPRGFYYRRCGVCKAVDRQQFQGQLVYVYGVANNILIDENLKASGLG